MRIVAIPGPSSVLRLAFHAQPAREIVLELLNEALRINGLRNVVVEAGGKCIELGNEPAVLIAGRLFPRCLHPRSLASGCRVAYPETTSGIHDRRSATTTAR